MHDFQEQCQTVFHVMLCLSIFSSKQHTIKHLLDSCFVISRIINPWLDLGVGQGICGNQFISEMLKKKCLSKIYTAVKSQFSDLLFR